MSCRPPAVGLELEAHRHFLTQRSRVGVVNAIQRNQRHQIADRCLDLVDDFESDQRPDVGRECAIRVEIDEHIPGHVVNGAIVGPPGPPVLVAAGNRGYRSPKMSGWAGRWEMSVNIS